jgi:hypothetical protein
LLPPFERELHVARFYMHLSDSTEKILDPEGLEFGTIDALRKTVLVSAGDLIKGDVDNGLINFSFRIAAEDEQGEIVRTLPFKQAVSIIPDVEHR